MHLLGSAIKEKFLEFYPNPDKLRKGRDRDPYGTIRAWFSGGNTMELLNDAKGGDYKKALEKVAGLKKLTETAKVPKEDLLTYMELVLHGLAEFNVINKDYIESKFSFHDMLANMLGDMENGNDFDF